MSVPSRIFLNNFHHRKCELKTGLQVTWWRRKSTSGSCCSTVFSERCYSSRQVCSSSNHGSAHFELERATWRWLRASCRSSTASYFSWIRYSPSGRRNSHYWVTPTMTSRRSAFGSLRTSHSKLRTWSGPRLWRQLKIMFSDRENFFVFRFLLFHV